MTASTCSAIRQDRPGRDGPGDTLGQFPSECFNGLHPLGLVRVGEILHNASSNRLDLVGRIGIDRDGPREVGFRLACRRRITLPKLQLAEQDVVLGGLAVHHTPKHVAEGSGFQGIPRVGPEFTAEPVSIPSFDPDPDGRLLGLQPQRNRDRFLQDPLRR